MFIFLTNNAWIDVLLLMFFYGVIFWCGIIIYVYFQEKAARVKNPIVRLIVTTPIAIYICILIVIPLYFKDWVQLDFQGSELDFIVYVIAWITSLLPGLFYFYKKGIPRLRDVGFFKNSQY